MLSKKPEHDRLSYEFMSIDELVPQDHLVRSIDRHIDFSFIYELVEPLYSPDLGRPSVDPVLLIKIPLIQYLFGIPSMRRTIEEINVNLAYRWFLGLGFSQKVPHFSTFGKNYTRRFKDTDLFEQIFERILEQIILADLVDTSSLFIDSTPVKAHANPNRRIKLEIEKETKSYEKKLQEEINAKREEDGKDPFDYDDGDETTFSTRSPVDPEAGMFIKGEHRRMFAYNLQVACDKRGWILDYSVCAGNEHDSRSIHELLDKIERYKSSYYVLDAGYKTSLLARILEEIEVQGVLPYTRPKGLKKEGYRKREFRYIKEDDLYLCPQGETLSYKRIDKNGNLIYQASPSKCRKCKDRDKCISEKSKFRIITRHIYEDSLDRANEFRLTEQGKELYAKRKETIERVFAEAKENHGLRYTRQVGKKLMELKAALSFTCINMKRYARLMDKRYELGPYSRCLLSFLHKITKSKEQSNQFGLIALYY